MFVRFERSLSANSWSTQSEESEWASVKLWNNLWHLKCQICSQWTSHSWSHSTFKDASWRSWMNSAVGKGILESEVVEKASKGQATKDDELALQRCCQDRLQCTQLGRKWCELRFFSAWSQLFWSCKRGVLHLYCVLPANNHGDEVQESEGRKNNKCLKLQLWGWTEGQMLKMKDSRPLRHQRSRVLGDRDTQLLIHLRKETREWHLPCDAFSSTGVLLLVNLRTLFWS